MKINELEEILDRYGYKCVMERDWPPGGHWYVDIIRPGRYREDENYITGSDKILEIAIDNVIDKLKARDWKI